MKKSKIIALVAALTMMLALIAGCAQTQTQTPAPSAELVLEDIVVGASPTPHAEILAAVKDVLAEEGYNLVIREFTDYVQPNLALENGELDANYFQHKPYLDDFNKEKGTNLVSVAAIHYEPFGIYPGKTKTLAELKDGAKVAVPNDTTNEARALLLLEAEGLIKLKEGAGLKATKNDIVENKKNLDIVEIEAAQIPRSLPDVDIAAINGNYALEANLNVVTDALAREDKDSLAGSSYANIVAVRKGDENREDIKALVAALKSDKVRTFIEETYKGTSIPVF